MSLIDDDIQLPPRYLGSVGYYAALSACRRAYIDPSLRFNKRDKETHRTAIANANGVIRLTVPIEKPASMLNTPLSDIRISGHDQWWNIHFTALASAYGRTPYFEYYADDFRRFYSPEWVGRSLTDYVAGLDTLVRRLLHIDTEVIYGPAPAGTRREVLTHPVEYYQVRALRQGFIPGLSIADLLFNLGPEGLPLLDRMPDPASF